MVISMAAIVKIIMDADISMQDALLQGYANYSAIARMIKLQVEEQMEKKVNMQSLIGAVKRYKTDNAVSGKEVDTVVSRSIINIRAPISKITIEKKRMNLNTVQTILSEYEVEFLQVLKVLSHITMILDQKIHDTIISLFTSDSILEEKKELAAIIIHSPKEIIDTPGCAIAFYNPISRKGINIEETMSCYTDTMIIIKIEDVKKALKTLNDFMFRMRRQFAQ